MKISEGENLKLLHMSNFKNIIAAVKILNLIISLRGIKLQFV